MNPFKWAKQQIAKAFEPKAAPAPRPRAQHPAKAEALATVDRLKKEAVRRLRSPTKAQRHKWAWFHVSKWPFKYTDPKTGEVSIQWAHKTYNVGRNKAKRLARAGLAGKSARRHRIEMRPRPEGVYTERLNKAYRLLAQAA